MRILVLCLALIITVALTGCESENNKGAASVSPAPAAETQAARPDAPAKPVAAEGLFASKDTAKASQPEARREMAWSPSMSRRGEGGTSVVSLTSASDVYAATEALNRKIIRNADLTLETDSPTEGLRKITSIAESHGGFVVTSEFKQNPVSPGGRPSQNVTVVARVPATQFASALDQIRSAGQRVISEKVSGQDVSEEYLDLEARLRTKKALEAQFLEIMKQARKVQDALDVQSELADVRTEIERLEGRRRFLENQAALSTITTTLEMPQPIVAATTSGFGASIKRTFGDSIDTAASIVLFLIQAVIVLFPVVLILGMPGWLLWRMLRRRLVVKKVEPSPVPNQ